MLSNLSSGILSKGGEKYIMTADELYNELLKIKNTEPNHQFIGLDLLQFGNVDNQFEELVYDGRVRKGTSILDDFEVVD